MLYRLNQKGMFGRKLYEVVPDEVVDEGKKPMLHRPVTPKRPGQQDHLSEQQLALQSMKSFFTDISKESHRGGGKDIRAKPGKVVQDGGGIRGGQNSQEWKRKGDKANWRGRDREEEGGVVEVRRKGEKSNWRSESMEDRVPQVKGRKDKDLEGASFKGEGRRLEAGVREDHRKDMHTRDGYGGEGKKSPRKQEGHQRDAVKGKHNPPDSRRTGKDTASHNEVQSQSHSSRSKREPGHELEAVGEGASSGSQDRRSGAKQGERTGRDSASSQKQSELRTRQIKDRNKSSRANHNRKMMADKKKRGGMI